MGYSQNNPQTNSSTFFAQCMINLDDEAQKTILLKELLSNPYIQMCRIDVKSKTCLIITKNIEALNPETVKSWFEEYSTRISCLYTGVYKVDKMKDFPLTDCK